jgi:DNA-binding XRE family transcriptional regulator
MPSPRLPNHLRAQRRRLALLQDDVAFILGKQDGRKVSQYELLDYLPNLATALAFEAIFKTPVSELFPNLYLEVEAEVIERARRLRQKIQLEGESQSNQRRRAIDDLAA